MKFKTDKYIRVYDGNRCLFFEKYKNNYHYNILLGKTSFESPKILLYKTSFFIKHKRYIMIKLMFLKELMIIRQANQKRTKYVNTGIDLSKRFKFQPYICNRFHNLLMMSMSLCDIAILRVLIVIVLVAKLTKVET